jgi:hypothetical protein
MSRWEPEKISTPFLLQQFADILDELKRRGVVRTRNNPVADYAEWLASRKLGLLIVGNSNSGYDAVNNKGDRFQIKGRRLDPTHKSRQLGVIRNLNAKEFDYLIGILFDRDFKVIEAYKIPRHIIEEHARFSSHQNGHILQLRGDILNHQLVQNLLNFFNEGINSGD